MARVEMQRLEIMHNGASVATVQFRPEDNHVTASLPLKALLAEFGFCDRIDVMVWPDTPHYIVLEVHTINPQLSLPMRNG
jgi:hypothetical protein